MSSELQPAVAIVVQGLTPINQRPLTPNQVVVSEQRWSVIDDDDEGITAVREKLPDYLETAVDRMEDAIFIGESKETDPLKSLEVEGDGEYKWQWDTNFNSI